MRFRLLFFLIGSVIIFLSCSKTDKKTKLYIDKSYKMVSYFDDEIPNLDINWTRAEIEKAIAVLDYTASKGKEYLPRYESEWTGDIFDKFVNNGSLKNVTTDSTDLLSYLDLFDINTGLCLALFDCYYIESSKNQPFSPEVLQAQLYFLSLYEMFYTVQDDFSQEINELSNTSELLDFIKESKEDNLDELTRAVGFALNDKAFRENDVIIYLKGLNIIFQNIAIHMSTNEKSKLRDAFNKDINENNSGMINTQIELLLEKLM